MVQTKVVLSQKASRVVAWEDASASHVCVLRPGEVDDGIAFQLVPYRALRKSRTRVPRRKVRIAAPGCSDEGHRRWYHSGVVEEGGEMDGTPAPQGPTAQVDGVAVVPHKLLDKRTVPQTQRPMKHTRGDASHRVRTLSQVEVVADVPQVAGPTQEDGGMSSTVVHSTGVKVQQRGRECRQCIHGEMTYFRMQIKKILMDEFTKMKTIVEAWPTLDAHPNAPEHLGHMVYQPNST